MSSRSRISLPPTFRPPVFMRHEYLRWRAQDRIASQLGFRRPKRPSENLLLGWYDSDDDLSDAEPEYYYRSTSISEFSYDLGPGSESGMDPNSEAEPAAKDKPEPEPEPEPGAGAETGSEAEPEPTAPMRRRKRRSSTRGHSPRPLPPPEYIIELPVSDKQAGPVIVIKKFRKEEPEEPLAEEPETPSTPEAPQLLLPPAPSPPPVNKPSKSRKKK
ncbi:hypothetical protein N7468_010683 [Penicillium chermesinum]|uniref:Uncharacterized protein n=1 Tax=Penicillium chermesinum TaxID=63820 RepID=A0A9W9N9R5_9EURO|nr:uncharacterized protein N7468_010683 [Penicillium chermesinum]KAJ5215004.1 hypothetical protein N7468_010683 [Penicillium chermesinum]